MITAGAKVDHVIQNKRYVRVELSADGFYYADFCERETEYCENDTVVMASWFIPHDAEVLRAAIIGWDQYGKLPQRG